jgi:multicomponent Na+:H+ antiporter subunit G
VTHMASGRGVVATVMAVIGVAFSLSGAVGILRMPDLYTRIQCSSKTITMGALPALVALVVAEGPSSSYGSRTLLVAVLLLIVNPLASHALARAAYKRGVPLWSGSVLDQAAQRQLAHGGGGGPGEAHGGGGGPGEARGGIDHLPSEG